MFLLLPCSHRLPVEFLRVSYGGSGGKQLVWDLGAFDPELTAHRA